MDKTRKGILRLTLLIVQDLAVITIQVLCVCSQIYLSAGLLKKNKVLKLPFFNYQKILLTVPDNNHVTDGK